MGESADVEPRAARAAPGSPARRPQDEVERLKEMNSFKTQLINAAAHELSTPLTPIRLQVHMLRSGERGPLTDAQRWSVEILDRNVERLSKLVREFLDIARLEAARFPVDMRPTDLGDVVKEAVEAFQDPARRAGLRLTYKLEPGLVIMADGHRLVQVLFSLIGNAIKYTESPGEVAIQARRVGPDAVISVTDTGVGFREEDKPKLFQPFSQIFNPERGFGTGAGLGLYITRNIVELHGGRIWAHSPGPGKGAKFSFSVPAASHEAGAPPAVQTARQPAAAEEKFAKRLRELI